MCECVWNKKLGLGLKRWHKDLFAFNSSIFLKRLCSFKKKGNCIDNAFFEGSCVRDDTERVWEFYFGQKNISSTEKTSSFPHRGSITLPRFLCCQNTICPEQLCCFTHLSKLFCFIVDLLTSNKVINQTMWICLSKLFFVIKCFFYYNNSYSQRHKLSIVPQRPYEADKN